MWRNSTTRYGSLQVALHWLMLVLLVAVLLASAMRLAISTYNPFIYFRF